MRVNLTLVTSGDVCEECRKTGLVRVTFKRGNTIVLCGDHSLELTNALTLIT